jgi:hypothetical protein
MMSARSVPIVARVDVLVVGGGPAGIGAALGAARAGATTALVERYGFLGGAATAAGVGPFMTSYSLDTDKQIIAGVFEELVQRLVKRQGAVHPSQVRDGSPESGFYTYAHDHVTPFDGEALKLEAAEMMLEAGVTLFLHSDFIEPVIEGKRISGAIIHNKSGLQAIAAQVVVDCTGDGDVAFRAGAPTAQGDSRHGLTQPVTMFFRVGNVDDAAVEAHIAAHPEEKGHLFPAAFAAALAAGELNLVRKHVGLYRSVQKGVWRVNTSRMQGVNGVNAADLSKAEVEGRRQVWQIMAFFRKRLPGFQNAVLLDSAPQVGVRETRRIIGDYVLTVEDLMSGRHFDDVIALASFAIDIHPVTGPGGGVESALQAGYKAAPVYEIPYRSLVPTVVENLLVAGRCLSATHEALGAVRVMPPCFAMGQAAGVAAALSISDNVSPRRVNIKRVQDMLKQQGAILQRPS